MIVNGNIPGSVNEIAFKPIKGHYPDVVTIQFVKKYIMVDSVKGFLQLSKDTTDKASNDKSIFVFFLCTGITFGTFRNSGNIPLLKDKLIIQPNGLMQLMGDVISARVVWG